MAREDASKIRVCLQMPSFNIIMEIFTEKVLQIAISFSAVKRKSSSAKIHGFENWNMHTNGWAISPWLGE